MGQRLVVTIETNEEKWCNIYYHWSAYTSSALEETRKIINCIYNGKHETKEELLLRLIRFCENNGGGIRGTAEEFEYIKGLYPNETFKTDNYSRNDGLIALSENGMTEMQGWSEGDVYINIDEDNVDFCVYSGYESLEEYLSEREEWDEDFDRSEFNDIPELDCCLGYFGTDEIDDVIAKLDSVGNHYVIKCRTEICELIE